MANTKNETRPTDEDVQAVTETEQVVELNLEQKVNVRSIAGWDTGFARKYDGTGDIMIAPGGSTRMSRNEIISQVQVGNRLFTGIDGYGSHATLYIEDAATRKEVGFDSEDGLRKQNVFNDKDVKEMFKLNQNSFEAKLHDYIRTRAEKYAVIEAIKRLGINDYSKIRFTEDYTGYRVQ